MLMYLFEFLSLSLELLIMIMYSHKKKTGKTLDDTKQERYNKRNFIGKPKKRPYRFTYSLCGPSTKTKENNTKI